MGRRTTRFVDLAVNNNDLNVEGISMKLIHITVKTYSDAILAGMNRWMKQGVDQPRGELRGSQSQALGQTMQFKGDALEIRFVRCFHHPKLGPPSCQKCRIQVKSYHHNRET
jgi:hypothetical protein